MGEWPEVTVKAARAALAKRTGRATPPNALTVKDAFEEWFADQIEPNYRRTNNTRVYVARAIAEFGKRRLQELSRPEIARAVPETREQFNGRRPLLFRRITDSSAGMVRRLQLDIDEKPREE